MSNIFLDPIWCSEHIEKIRNKIGNKANHRHKHGLNIDISMDEIEVISRSEKFYIEIRENYGKLSRRIEDTLERMKDSDEFGDFKEISDDLLKELKKIKCFSIEEIPWQKIADQSEKLINILSKLSEKLIDILYELSKKSQNEKTKRKYDSLRHFIGKAQETLTFFYEYATSNKSLLSNNPFLFLVGEAGIGKTHLLCKIVSDRLNTNTPIAPSVLVFGKKLNGDEEIMPRVICLLHLGESIKNNRQFLEQLNEAGKKANCRSLFILDAANEILNLRDSRQLMQIIQKLYEEVRDYPYIALVISVRKGVEYLFINEVIKNNFQIISHPGFGGKEEEAMDLFFREYKVPLPEIPLLHPEFSNPLFLLFFCIAFEKRSTFRGHEGANHIFENFVKRVSREIITKHGLPKGRTDNKHPIWDTVIKKIAEHMVENHTDRLSKQEAINIIHEAHPKVEAVKFLKDIESNMLVAKVSNYDIASEQQPNCDYCFPFQKFSDHLRARYILKKYRNQKETSKKTLKQFFAKNTRLGKHLLNSNDIGLIEALMIQCPEHFKGTEFLEAAPYLIDKNFIFQAFIDSLVWRKPTAFSLNTKNFPAKTIKLISELVRKNYPYNKVLYKKVLDAYIFDVCITVSGCPEHPLNAKFLHRWLEKFSMPERDSRWSVFLHYQSNENTAIERLLEWAWSKHSQEHLHKESLLLLSKTLVWFLTTSNRIVRDKATKGLVRTLTDHLDICLKLLEIFKDVNDVYVLERLYAVIYGCVMRNFTDESSIKKIALWIYDKQFSESRPLPHLLLRDYARGVIEIALNREILSKIDIDRQKINPPYKSDWITQPYTKEKLEQKYYPKGKSAGNRGMWHIWNSVIGWGDFDRYIIGTNSRCEWSGRRLRQKAIDKSVLFNDFINSLTPEQRVLWDECNADSEEILGPITVVKEKMMRVRKTVENFKNSLDEGKCQLFENNIFPYLDHAINKRFDLRTAQRWILNRVYELGWNPEMHGEFDSCISSQGRDSHKPERIGKKYQWLAYYEFFARVSDNFEFAGWGNSNTEQADKRHWHLDRRDIDPSFNLRPDMEKPGVIFEKWENKYLTYNAWNKDIWDWVKSSKSMPEPEKIILIRDDEETEWLLLNGYIEWAEDISPEEDKNKSPGCNMWYMFNSYIVHSNDYQAAIRWANQLSTGMGMPENDFYEVFLGEYPNSEAYTDIRSDMGNWDDKEKPASLRYTGATYINDIKLDCSLQNRFTIKMPSKFIINGMNLKQPYVDGKFYDEEKTLIASPISIWKDSKLSGVLIRKNSLLEFLQRTNNKIFWICSAEKYNLWLMSMTGGKEGLLDMGDTYTLNKNGDISGKLKQYKNNLE